MQRRKKKEREKLAKRKKESYDCQWLDQAGNENSGSRFRLT